MSLHPVRLSSALLVLLLAFVAYLVAVTNADVHNYTFIIRKKTVTRLCKKRIIATVNGQLPGPTIHVRDGDVVNIKAYNKAGYNATLHWHGVEQLRTGWADGPAYVTQCPIPPGGRYTYRFTISEQEGTVWWHAHVSWLRATVHGAFVILPKRGKPYPFPKPRAEVPIVIGEWWNNNPVAVIDEAVRTGGAPNVSDAFTINGQPGDLFPCSSSGIRFSFLFKRLFGGGVLSVLFGDLYLFPHVGASGNGETPVFFRTPRFVKMTRGEWAIAGEDILVDRINLKGGIDQRFGTAVCILQSQYYPVSETFRFAVKQGENYLLRIVNAALNSGHFFKIAGHEFTVVAVDACYTKPYKTDVLVIAAGQTTDVLLTANQPVGKYYMAARAYNNQAAGAFDNTTATAILEYIGHQHSTRPIMPSLPYYNDTATVNRFSNALRSLASREYPVDVPRKINEDLIMTVGLGLSPCGTGKTCEGPNGMRLSASVNNLSYVEPTVALLQAYYFSINGVFTMDFPSKPPVRFNYTGEDIIESLWVPDSGPKLKVLDYGSTVQLVFQATNIFVAENHPMHLHGYNFYVVGQGSGNYNPVKDQLNLIWLIPHSATQ